MPAAATVKKPRPPKWIKPQLTRLVDEAPLGAVGCTRSSTTAAVPFCQLHAGNDLTGVDSPPCIPVRPIALNGHAQA
jgi:hypothetical protein